MSYKYSRKAMVCATTMLTILCGIDAAQAITVDGIDTVGDNYANSKSLGFAGSDCTGSSAPSWCSEGQLKWTVDGDNIFVLISIPTDHVDNVFGVGSSSSHEHHSAPTGHVADAGWTQDHPYNKLEGSDKIRFTLASDGGNGTIELDLINKNTDPSPNRSLVKTDSGNLLLGKTGLSDPLRMKSSLEYDIQNFLPGVTNSSESLETTEPGWETQIKYEFVLDGTKFASTGFGAGNFSAVDLHASPSKTGTNSWTPDCMKSGGPTCADTPPDGHTVAEPGTTGTLMAGLFSLFYFRRRKSAAV